MKPKERKAPSGNPTGTDKKGRNMKTSRRTETRVTTKQATGTSKKVLNTVELLEAVLVHLPAKDIFKSQMVCRQFRDVITSSTQLKRKLFYLTSNLEESWDLCSDIPITSPLDSIEAEMQLIPHDEKNTNIMRASLTPASISPLFEIGPDDLGKRKVLRRLGPEEQSDMAVLMVRNLHRARGSWRGMHLTDPPCKTAVIDWANVTITGLPQMRDVHVQDIRVEVASGVTLGDLVDALCTTQKTRVFSVGGPRVAVQSKSIDEWNERFRAERGGVDELEIMSLFAKLEGVVIPSDDDRAKMKENGVLQEKG